MDYSGSLFSPIDWNNSSAENELKRRQELNAQIDWMNQMSQQNSGNNLIQQALLKQYMGLMPQAQDPENELTNASQLLTLGNTLGNQDITNAAMNMIKKNPILSQYFGGTDSTTASSPTDDINKQIAATQIGNLQTNSKELTDPNKIKENLLQQAFYNSGQQLGDNETLQFDPTTGQLYRAPKNIGLGERISTFFNPDLMSKYTDTNQLPSYGLASLFPGGGIYAAAGDAYSKANRKPINPNSLKNQYGF